MTALAALTERVVINTVRDLDLVFAVLAPIGAYIGFTFILRNLIDTGGMSYPQYVLPITVIQAAVFSSITTADRAARDQASGFGVRLYTLPISTATPLMARMLYCFLRGVLSLVSALAVAFLFGFRMNGGPASIVLFVALTMALTMALSFGADAVGTRLCHIEAPSQLLLLPQMLLVLLSTGLAPTESFPDWLQPFIRNQPVSQVADALRALSVGNADHAILFSASAWCVGLLVVLSAYALRVQKRFQ